MRRIERVGAVLLLETEQQQRLGELLLAEADAQHRVVADDAAAVAPRGLARSSFGRSRFHGLIDLRRRLRHVVAEALHRVHHEARHEQ